jgi:hypothetical protein
MANETTRPAHPPLHGGNATSSTDYCSRAGAILLANKIAAAWQRVGVTVETRVERIGARNDAAMFTVKMPSLVNGLPARTVAVPT